MKNTFLFLLLCMLSWSCEKQNLRSANNSLVGNWSVTEIHSATGERTTNGIDITDSETETGNLGNFDFTEEDLNYNFTRQNSTTIGTSTWTLTRTKENSGFTQVEVYTLLLDGFTFDCAFGDQTSDAEKNATELVLTSETPEIGDYLLFSLKLEKE